MQFSADGEWFWDGSRWHPAHSPDRRWRWDGTRWIPTSPPMQQQWRYEPTKWTRRLQVILIPFTVVGWVVGLELVNAFALPAAQRTVDPNLDADSLRSTIMTSYLLGVVVGVAFVGMVVTGILRLWRWVYWYLAVTYLIAPLASLQYAATYAADPSSAPGWLLLIGVLFALLEAATGIWMIVLYRRYGTWARRRVPAAAGVN